MSKIEEKKQELIILKIKEVPNLSMGYMMSFWFCLEETDFILEKRTTKHPDKKTG